MRRKYGTIFIAFVLLFIFQIVILDESFASFHTEQDACETTGNCPYAGSYGPAPKSSQYHRIGTSIHANSIRQEAEDPQVTPQQYPYDPNSYPYGQSGYYDPYRPVAVDPSIYDTNSGIPYGGFNDPSISYGDPYYNAPNVGTSYPGYNDPGTLGSNTYPGYNDPGTLGSNTYPGYNDPGILGSNTFPSYYDPGSYTDPSGRSSGYTEYADPEIVNDPGSGGGIMSGISNMLSGLDVSSMSSALGAIGNMLGGQGALTSAINPASAVTPLATTLNAPSSLISAASAGIPAASSFSTDGLDANIGRPSTSNSETSRLLSSDSSGTGSLPDVNPTSDVESPLSQNLKDEISHSVPTSISQNPNTLWDVEGQSSKPVGSQASKTQNNLDVVVNNPHSITPRNPNKVASLWDAVNYFNSQTEDSGKSNPMLIFTPVDLDKTKLLEEDYVPVLSDEEIAKLYNGLGKKKIKSVLLLTDNNVDTPHELFDEIYSPVLEETGGNKHLFDKLGENYQFIPFSDDSTDELIPVLNTGTFTQDEVINLFNSQIRRNNEDVLEQIRDYYEIIPKEQESTSKPTSDIEIDSNAGEKFNISTRVRKGNEDFMKRLDNFYEFIPAGMDYHQNSQDSQKPTAGIVPHFKMKEKSPMNIDSSRDSNNKSLASTKYNEILPVQKSTESSGSLTNREIMPIFLLTDDAENFLKNLNHSQQFKRESDDVIETLSKFYKFEPIGVDSPRHSGLDTKMYSPENGNSSENNSDRVRKHNQDIINSMSEYYEFIPSGGKSFDQSAPEIKIHSSGNENHAKNDSQRVRKHNQDMIDSMSEYYEFIPSFINSSDQNAPETKIYSSNNENHDKNHSQRVRKHNQDMIDSMSEYYEFIPSITKSSDQNAPETKIYSSDNENHDKNDSQRVRKHNQDMINSMSEYYEFIPSKKYSLDQTAPETKIYSSEKNDAERVRKHNNDIIKLMSEYYEFIPLKEELSDETAPGTKIYSSNQEVSKDNDSERVRKNTDDIIKSMSDFYEFIPFKEELSDKTAPETKVYSSDEVISNKNNSERVRKHNNDMIRSMSDFYEFIPNGISSLKRPSPAIQPQSIINDDQSAIRVSNENDITDVHAIMDSIENNKLSTLTPRVYRMIPKIGDFTKSGIDVKNYILEDLKSKFESKLNLDDKLVVINNGVGKSKEYFLAKKRTNSSGEKSSCKACGLVPKTFEPSQKPCQPSPITCEQKPSKYIFRLTCYDPETHHSHTGNKSLILHFDCLNKISPLITNILKNVDNHHCASSTCDTSKTCKNRSYDDSRGGESFTKAWKNFPDFIDNSAYNNNYYNPVYSTDSHVSLAQINSGYGGEGSINYQDFKPLSENSYTKPTVPEEISFKNLEVYQSEKYEKSGGSGESDVYDSTRSKSFISSIPFQSGQPLNNPYDTPRSGTIQHTPKFDLNIGSNLPSPQQNFRQEKYEFDSDTAPKSSNYDSYYSPNSPPVDSNPDFGSSYEQLGISPWPSIPEQGLSTWNSQLETQPTFLPKNHQSSPDTTPVSSNYEDEKYDFRKKLTSDHPCTTCNKDSNIYQITPTKCEQKKCIEKEKASSKLREYEVDKDCEKCRVNDFRNSVYDSPQESMIKNGRNSIMTISKCDKAKYADKIKDSGLEQGVKIENSSEPIVIEKRISEAIETLLNNSLQPSCNKGEKISSCHLSTGVGNLNKQCSNIIKPVNHVNTNKAGNLDELSISVHQCPEIPKCHLEEHVSTKHTQKILKNQDSTKLVHGFECKKTIQSNLCGDSIGPCNTGNDCKMPLPSASKECETLANFLDKISQTLDNKS